jgi:hypothetical protein
MQEVVFTGILLVDLIHCLPGLQEIVIHKEVECLCLVELYLLLHHHNELVDVERFEDQYSVLVQRYLLLLTSFSLERGAFLMMMGTLSEWNFLIISASFIRSSSVYSCLFIKLLLLSGACHYDSL